MTGRQIGRLLTLIHEAGHSQIRVSASSRARAGLDRASIIPIRLYDPLCLIRYDYSSPDGPYMPGTGTSFSRR